MNTVSELLTELFTGVAVSHLEDYKATQATAVWFDKTQGGYIWQDIFGSRVVDDGWILQRIDHYHEFVISEQMRRQTENFITGNITLATWQERIAGNLKDAYVVNLQLGRGGKAVTTFSDYGRIGGRLKFEYAKLDQFAQEINLGQLSEKQIMARIQQYANGARTAFHDGKRAAKLDAGFNEERRYTNPAEHCDDCVGYEALGWQPIGSLPPPGTGSVCMHNCKCDMDYRVRPDEPLETTADAISPEISNAGEKGNQKSDAWFKRDGNPGDYDIKEQAMREISEAIAGRTNFDFDDVYNFLDRWNSTSNDTNMQALQIQEIASQRFGTPLSDWQRGQIGKVVAEREEFASIIEAGKRDWYSIWEDSLGKYIGPTEYANATEATGAMLDEMYAFTQEQLKEQGIGSVKLYRGFKSFGDAELSAFLDANHGKALEISGNAIESWTTNREVAENFGNYVFEVEVPASRVVSTGRTGMGVLHEYEYVISGGRPGDFARVWAKGL